MPTPCIRCGDPEATHVASGPVIDAFRCAECGHEFTKFSKPLRRALALTALALLNDMQESGLRGTLVLPDDIRTPDSRAR